MNTFALNMRITLLILLCISCFVGVMANNNEKKKVLIISSYNSSFPTFFEQINGIKSVLDTSKVDLDLDVEFMDSKRFFNEENTELFKKLITYKLQNSKPYDVVITTDDNAQIFVLNNQESLFKEIPIVFCAVNNIARAIEQNNNKYMTGVIEAVSMKETIDLMLKLNPDSKQIIAISDNTPSGQGDLQTYYKLANTYPEIDFNDISLTKLSFNELSEVLSTTSSKIPVLLLSAYHDKNGKTIDFHESLKLIKKTLNSQLFHLWHHGLGDGIIGGKLISHYEQGRVAAIITLEVLSGAQVSDIEVITQSPNKYFFDFLELKLHDVSLKVLPDNSTVINLPQTFYSKNREIINTIILIFILLITFILILLSNIYRRHKTEKELRSTKARQEAMISNISDVIALIDKQGNIIYKTQNIKEIFGWNPKDLIGHSGLENTHPDDLERISQEYNNLLQKVGGKTDVEYRYKCKDGSYKTIHLIAKNLLNIPEVQGVLVNYHDISERKNAEERLISLNEEYCALNEELTESIERIQNINTELEEAKEKAEESDRLKSSFLANLSHEIRTPMNGILGFSELLQNPDIANEKRDNYIKVIHNSGQYLLSIIDDILEISRIETGQISLNINKINLNSIVYELYNALSVTIPEEKNIDFKLSRVGIKENIIIHADEVKLKQVISNLVTNAIKYTKHGHVAISYKKNKKGELEFTIEDTGIGIHKKDQELIFNRFCQVEGDMAIQTGGSGLGLSISKAYIELMGGRISLKSEPGKGSVFTFSIPVKFEEEENKSSENEPSPEIKIAGNNDIILIAEDDDINYMLFEELFADSNIQLKRALNGKEAVDVCDNNDRIKLVLMDLKMPILDGYKATKIIKQNNPSLPVIAQTAHAISKELEQIKDAGFDGYIAKPIQKDELFNLIESSINNSNKL